MSTTDTQPILADLVPDFTGTAACSGLWWTFDPPRPRETRSQVLERWKLAQEICSDCPVLSQCREWFQSISDDDRPGGVVAGEIYYRFSGRQSSRSRPASSSRCSATRRALE